jgi:hypothetical protein
MLKLFEVVIRDDQQWAGCDQEDAAGAVWHRGGWCFKHDVLQSSNFSTLSPSSSPSPSPSELWSFQTQTLQDTPVFWKFMDWPSLFCAVDLDAALFEASSCLCT